MRHADRASLLPVASVWVVLHPRGPVDVSLSNYSLYISCQVSERRCCQSQHSVAGIWRCVWFGKLSETGAPRIFARWKYLARFRQLLDAIADLLAHHKVPLNWSTKSAGG